MSTILPPGITNPSTQCTISTCPLSLAQLFYIPSLAGNLFYLILFSLLLPEQLRLGMQYRTWGFTSGIFGGLVLEILGYVGRVQMHYNPFKVDPFLLYIICLTVAPAFLSASIYLCLSRLVVASDPSNRISRLKPRTYTAIFVTADTISLLLQAAGGAIASISAKSHPRTAAEKKIGDHGVKIMVAGLVFQVVSLGVFLGLWGEFEWRLKSVCDTAEKEVRQGAVEDEKVGGGLTKISEDAKDFEDLTGSPRFSHFKIALWLAAVLIFIRSVYRVIELNAGFAGKLANNEPSFMILEGPMIIIAVLALTVLHPGSSFAGRWNEANWSFRSKV